MLLPFVPVMATTGQSSSRKATSTSARTAMPRRTASTSSGASARHARAGHHQIDAVEQRRRLVPEPEVDVRPLGRVDAQVRGGLRVGDPHAHAPGGQQAGDRSARAAEPDDERTSRQVHQRSLSVESARSAQMMATIQKRTMICGSGQPRSSK